MKFPKNPEQGQKFVADSGFTFVWNGAAWDMIAKEVKKVSTSTSTSSEEVKEFFNPDGETRTFQMGAIPLDGSLKVFLNGMLQKEDENYDYILEDDKVTFLFPPSDDSDIQLIYRRQVYTSVANEIPVGEIDGENNSFRLSSAPYPESEQVFLNGLLQRKGVDYSIYGNLIVFNDSPIIGNVVICNYKV
jgi:hypothetical protein